MAQINNKTDRDCLQHAPELIALIASGSMSQAAYVAAELRIPDLLASGPKHVDALANATESHAPSLHRLLRALTTLDLCTECENGSFALSPMGSLLRSDASNSLRSLTLYRGRYQGSNCANLLHSIKTGESARNDFGHLDADSEAADVFNSAMVQMTRLVASEVVQAYDFAGV